MQRGSETESAIFRGHQTLSLLVWCFSEQDCRPNKGAFDELFPYSCCREKFNPYNTWPEDSRHNQVLVIMATNRPESLDPKLRRPGYTDRELIIGLPGPDVRIDIFNVSDQGLIAGLLF